MPVLPVCHTCANTYKMTQFKLWNLWGDMVFFYVKEFDVIVHKKNISLNNPINFVAILFPTPLANLVVKVGTSKVTRSYCQGQTHRFIQLIENRVREKGEMLSIRKTCVADMLLHFNSVGMIMRALSMSAVHLLPWKKSAYLFDFSGYIPYEGFFSHCILKLLYEASFF